MVAKSETMNVTLACAFFLLPDKQYNTYSLVLNKIKELGVSNPDVFHLDFEAAAVKAVKNTFPGTVIECCDTHWKRCLREHQKELGLIPHINLNVEIQNFCRKLWALSYVPQKDVVDVYTKVILPTMPEVDADNSGDEVDDVNNYTESLDQYLTYFEATWIGAVNKRTQVRGKPKFSMNLWVKYEAVKEGREDLTSNRSEAWNSANKISIPMKPNIWVVCKAIKEEEGLARAKLHAAMGGNPPSDPNPGRTKKRVNRTMALKKIVDQYGSLPITTYLDALVSHFNDA